MKHIHLIERTRNNPISVDDDRTDRDFSLFVRFPRLFQRFAHECFVNGGRWHGFGLR